MNETHNTEFGKRLKHLREERNLSLSQLASEVNSTKSALSRYENNQIEPGLSTLVRLSKYFGVTLDWLCGNGSISEGKYPPGNDYSVVIDKLIEGNISSDKLEILLEVFKK